MFKFIRIGAGIIGTILLIINLIGIYKGNGVWFKPKKMDSTSNFTFYNPGDSLNIRSDETPMNFAIRMTDYVHKHTVHYFYDNNKLDNINIMVCPVNYSWTLWLRGLYAAIFNKSFKVEFCNAEKGLERGYGLCSQRALILHDALRRNGLKSKVVDLYGHVICILWLDNKEILLDPDYGIMIPASLEYIKTRPEIVRGYYDQDTDYLTSIYKAGAWDIRMDHEYSCVSNYELAGYKVLQWIIPLLLLFTAFNGLQLIKKYIHNPITKK